VKLGLKITVAVASLAFAAILAGCPDTNPREGDGYGRLFEQGTPATGPVVITVSGLAIHDGKDATIKLSDIAAGISAQAIGKVENGTVTVTILNVPFPYDYRVSLSVAGTDIGTTDKDAFNIMVGTNPAMALSDFK